VNPGETVARPITPPLPPQDLRFMAENDEQFLALGDQIVSDLAEHAGLSAGSAILDMGCGYGRVAHALMRSGLHDGTYLGVDILQRHLGWCTENLSPLAPGRVSFEHANIQNDRYNPKGTVAAGEVRFPANDSSVDLVILTSVLTHMMPGDARHYLRETGRVLKPGGRAYVTFFLLNRSWRSLDRQGKPIYPLPHRLGPFSRYMNPDDKLHVIAYREPWVRWQARRSGLAVEAVLPGSWCGRESPRGQDAVVLRA
jgi:SAM-dependent methyltransferase